MKWHGIDRIVEQWISQRWSADCALKILAALEQDRRKSHLRKSGAFFRPKARAERSALDDNRTSTGQGRRTWQPSDRFQGHSVRSYCSQSHCSARKGAVLSTEGVVSGSLAWQFVRGAGVPAESEALRADGRLIDSLASRSLVQRDACNVAVWHWDLGGSRALFVCSPSPRLGPPPWDECVRRRRVWSNRQNNVKNWAEDLGCASEADGGWVSEWVWSRKDSLVIVLPPLRFRASWSWERDMDVCVRTQAALLLDHVPILRFFSCWNPRPYFLPPLPRGPLPAFPQVLVPLLPPPSPSVEEVVAGGPSRSEKLVLALFCFVGSVRAVNSLGPRTGRGWCTACTTWLMWLAFAGDGTGSIGEEWEELWPPCFLHDLFRVHDWTGGWHGWGNWCSIGCCVERGWCEVSSSGGRPSGGGWEVKGTEAGKGKFAGVTGRCPPTLRGMSDHAKSACCLGWTCWGLWIDKQAIGRPGPAWGLLLLILPV